MPEEEHKAARRPGPSDARTASRVARRVLGHEDVDDVVQLTLIEALRAAPPDAARRMPWIRTVARRFAIDQLRREKATKQREQTYAR
ncbi:MAG: sigma factor [Planctomycetota bacterium]